MRDKRIYTKTISISEKDLVYIKKLKEKDNKKSLAGILALMIKEYRKK